jgi:hypothetical protein
VVGKRLSISTLRSAGLSTSSKPEEVMSLSNSRPLRSPPVYGLVNKAAVVEPGADEAVSVPLVTEGLDLTSWTYSDSAEDHGAAGSLDLSPGLIYSGPPGAHATVRVRGVDVSESTLSATIPEEGDTAAMVVYKNSEVVWRGDEGQMEYVGEAVVENNLDAVVPVVTNDVIRVGFAFTGEEADADLSIESAGEIAVST